MGGLTKQYVLTRMSMWFITIFIGATAVFFIPRLAPGDPVTGQITRMMEREGRVENAQEIIAAWKKAFGLDDPLHIQYIKYLGNLARFDFGYSLAKFPIKAWDVVKPALPWSVGLLMIATALSFGIGITIGALMGWRKTPRWLQNILPFSLTFASIPYFMFGILLVYVVAFELHWLPATGGYDRTVDPGWNIPFIKSVISHSILPIVSIVLAAMGGWALGMRGLMIGVNNEDFFLLALAKGLSPSRVFFRYGMRNAILPALTALALGLAGLISGSLMVEFIFAYPGTGYTLYQAIITQDYPVMQTICNLMILITATSVFLLDLSYPLIDPRITFRKNQA
jgi:peptide/nickel transport system permease protein